MWLIFSVKKATGGIPWRVLSSFAKKALYLFQLRPYKILLFFLQAKIECKHLQAKINEGETSLCITQKINILIGAKFETYFWWPCIVIQNAQS